jgi:hypothetical protein
MILTDDLYEAPSISDTGQGIKLSFSDMRVFLRYGEADILSDTIKTLLQDRDINCKRGM